MAFSFCKNPLPEENPAGVFFLTARQYNQAM